MNERSLARCIAALLLSLVVGAAEAQWPDDPAANLSIADRTGEQVQAKLRVTADGGAYVSWFDNSTGGYDVYLQRLDADGNELWAHNGVLIADRGFSSTQDYDLDIDTAGNALLAFRDDRSGSTQITATKVSPAGVQLWGATGVQLTTGTDFVAAPKIAGTTDGQAVVAWTNDGDVRLQKLDASGAAQWGFGVTIPAIGGDSTSASDMDASDGGGVIISMVRGFLGPKHLYAQKYNGAGAPQWGGLTPLAVFDGGALQTANFPQFVPDGSGGAAFAWYSVHAGLQCHAQWIQADGSEAFGHNGVTVSTAAASRTAPVVSHNGATSETFVFWREETGPPTPTYGVYGQKLDAAGARLWGAGGTVVEPLSTTELVQIRQAAVGDGAEVLWVETLAFGEQLVHAARLNNDGSFRWTPPVTTVSSVVSGKSRLEVAATPSDAVLAVWSDSRNDANDVYGQRIAPDGALGADSVPGSVTGLRIAKSIVPGALSLSWSPTCGVAADYGIYEGTLGSWYNHGQVDCSDDGADLVELIFPAADDRYFLVVAQGDQEGSYGTDSESNERPTPGASCLQAQNTTPCP